MKDIIIKFHKVLIKALLKINEALFKSDAIKKVRVGKFEIFINGTHQLPRYLKNNANYSSNFPRLAKHLKTYNQNLKLIDVGANVGDTVALVKSQCEVPIACIEGDKKYFSILKKNVALFQDVEIFNIFLDEKPHIKQTSPISSNGTTRLFDDVGTLTTFTTLNLFINEHPKYADSKLLKIDTDGYDLRIIRGGLEYISKTKPVIFFEYDRFFLTEINDDGVTTIEMLKEVGYKILVFYDNNGRFLISLSTEDTEKIKQLYQYTYKKKGSFPYYDVCAFHIDDEKMAETFIEQETVRQNENII